MRPKIVFVVMSAVHTAAAVDQLARSLAPHTVLVHHDFSQTPDFELKSPNVLFVPEPKRTGWAFFGFVEGIFHAMGYALRHVEFDYLQLLSPSCLPIKSMRQFEAHVSGDADAHVDCIDVLANQDALMTVGYRAFTPENSLRFRVARRLSREYFGDSAGRRDEPGFWLRSGFATRRDGRMALVPRLALATIKALSKPSVGRHIFNEHDFRPYVGSAWFGARRPVVARMVEEFARPRLHSYFRHLRHSDEFLLPTLLMKLSTRPQPSNHYVHTFVESRAGWIEDDLFDLLARLPAHFARKFPDASDAPIRVRVLNELVGPGALPVPSTDDTAPIARRTASQF